MNSYLAPARTRNVARRTRFRRIAALNVGLSFMLTFLTPTVRSQTAPSGIAPVGGKKDEVNVMTEFKVYDKKPVPFTDANMDIPRGINDVQAYYVIGADEIENSGKANNSHAQALGNSVFNFLVEPQWWVF